MRFSKPVPGGPCWVELSTVDIPAAKTFYAALFGWRSETDPREEAGGYTMARVGNAAVAALSPIYRPEQLPAWTVSFAVEDTDATVETVRAAGGGLLVGPMDVFDQGRFAVVADPSGAVFSLWQAHAFHGAELLNAPGTMGWVELVTHQADRARTFYPTVFGWTDHTSQGYVQWSKDGSHFGGLREMAADMPPEEPAHWLPYFVVPNVDSTAATAQSGGGDVLLQPLDVPSGPRIAVIRDPHGAVFGIYGTEPDG
ncbi:VOC family protein [Streptomyces sp. DT24]|uniref:VOC family protein n=1 Tax=unclassified Streptomyces TaxID=2593676 RepID=UPI0023B9A0D7|nr:VOC family protein [Streptomyces sp. AM 4-1-1]WEH36772.1 VOC family protein [Streptomyces sp. AM 4-1-1]